MLARYESRPRKSSSASTILLKTLNCVGSVCKPEVGGDTDASTAADGGVWALIPLWSLEAAD